MNLNLNREGENGGLSETEGLLTLWCSHQMLSHAKLFSKELKMNGPIENHQRTSERHLCGKSQDDRERRRAATQILIGQRLLVGLRLPPDSL